MAKCAAETVLQCYTLNAFMTLHFVVAFNIINSKLWLC